MKISTIFFKLLSPTFKLQYLRIVSTYRDNYTLLTACCRGISAVIGILWTFQSRKRLYNCKCLDVHSSISLSVSLKAALLISLKSSSFIIHLSSFIILQLLSFFIHPSFISRLLSFSACFYTKREYVIV